MRTVQSTVNSMSKYSVIGLQAELSCQARLYHSFGYTGPTAEEGDGLEGHCVPGCAACPERHMPCPELLRAFRVTAGSWPLHSNTRDATRESGIPVLGALGRPKKPDTRETSFLSLHTPQSWKQVLQTGASAWVPRGGPSLSPGGSEHPVLRVIKKQDSTHVS